MNHLKIKIEKLIQERILENTKGISSGSINNLKDYGYQCGFVQGMDVALGIMVEKFDEFYKSEGYDPDDDFE